METKEILKSVKKIEIKTKHLVEGLLQGEYHSIFKGRGIEFSEVREYMPGDDIRTIDWNVTARMNTPYVKEYIEERDLTLMILLDMSGSNNFGSEKEKRITATEIAASLMFSAVNNNDKAGLILFTSSIEKYIPPRKGKRHALKMIREMVNFEPKSLSTDLRAPLKFASKILKKKSIIFVISDFYSENYQKELKILRNRHDVIAINLNDEREKILLDLGYVQLEDEETGEQILVDTSDPEFLKNYTQLARKHDENMKKTLKKLKIDSISMNSSTSVEVPLRKFFSIRTRKLSRG